MPTLTRRELYDLVWSTPMVRLAETFGISDVGLAKVCAKHRVPRPPRGYWARKDAGYKVKQAIFSRVDDPLLDRIEIAGALNNLPPAVRDVVQRQKADRKTSPRQPPPDHFSGAALPSVETPHQALRAIAKGLRSRATKNDSAQRQSPGLGGLAVSKDSVERIVSFLDALVRMCEARGIAFVALDDRMSASVEPDGVSFRIEEAVDRTPHSWTDAEIAEEERRRKRRERARWDWSDLEDWGRKPPEFDYQPSGKFGLVVSDWSDGLRRSWRDGKHQSLESLLPVIVDGLEAHIVAIRHRRETRERAELAHRELERRRGLAKARKERENRRHSLVEDLIKAEEKAKRLEAWMGSWRARGGIDEPAVARMLAWAGELLKDTEKLLDTKALATFLEDAALFPEQDDLFDPLGEPPAPTSPWG